MTRLTTIFMGILTVIVLGTVTPATAAGCGCPPSGSCSLRSCNNHAGCTWCFYDCPGGQECVWVECPGEPSETMCD